MPSISSGAISGVGFAIAKTIASSAIARMPSNRHRSRGRQPDEDVSSHERIVGTAPEPPGFGLVGEHSLEGIERSTSRVESPLPVATR